MHVKYLRVNEGSEKPADLRRDRDRVRSKLHPASRVWSPHNSQIRRLDQPKMTKKSVKNRTFGPHPKMVKIANLKNEF